MAFPVTTIPPSSAGGGSSPPFAISDTTGLQDALDDKVDSPLSAAEMPTGIDAAKLADGSVSNTELQYINSLTSNAQTQLTAKLDKAGGTMTGDLVIPIGNLKPSGSGGANMVVKQASSGGALSVAALVPGDIPANSGLAYGYLTMTADDSTNNTPTLISWDTNSLSGMTLSSNEITIGETGHYEIGIKAIFAGMTAGTFCVLRLENWTSGSSVVIDLGRDAYPTTGTQCYVGINWRGPLASGTKLRVYQFCASGASGAIDGDGSTSQNTACFWDIRRAR